MSENKPEISIHEIAVNGRKFFCSFSEQKNFNEFIDSIKGEEIKVTYLHSVKASLEKRDDKDDTEYCYATITLTKKQSLFLFSRLADRFRDLSKLLLGKIEECPEAVALLEYIMSMQHKERNVLLQEFCDFVFNSVMGTDVKETDESYKRFQDRLERIIKKE